MTGEPSSGGANDKDGWKAALGRLCIDLLLIGAAIALYQRLSQSQVLTTDPPDHQEEFSRELHEYVVGFGLALVLTIVPFALVYWSMMSRLALYIAIGAFALSQIVVHFRCFLHIDPPRQNVDDLHLILFSSLILLVMAGGTIWILFNLALRMH